MVNIDEHKDESDHVRDNNPDSTLRFWQRYQIPIMLTTVGGAIDTIGFIGLLGFFTNHVTGNLVMAGGGLVEGGAGLLDQTWCATCIPPHSHSDQTCHQYCQRKQADIK